MLLQLGAEHGLTLFEIGSIMYREDRGIDAPVQESKLEKIVSSCLDAALTVAGEQGVADLVSSTLAGLDLAPAAGGKLARQGSQGNTPLMGPSSPAMSPPSPGGGPAARGTTGGGLFEPPPPFTLDPLSESEQEVDGDALTRSHCASREGLFARQLSGDEREGLGRSAQESPPPGTPAMYPQHSPVPKLKQTTGQSYRGGTKLRQRTSAALASLHREGSDPQDRGEGAIFSRPGLAANSTWSSELENAFRRQSTNQLKEFLLKNFPERAAEVAKRRAERAAAGDAPPLSKAMSPKREEDTSLASALPKVLPDDDGCWMQPEKAAGVRQERAETAPDGFGFQPTVRAAEPPPAAPQPPTISEAAEPTSSPSAAAAPPAAAATDELPKRKYIPPQLRKRLEREAAEAAAAAAAAAAGEADKSADRQDE